MAKNILIVAGEVSSDSLASQLIRELRRNDSSFCYFGLGGHSLQQAGVRLIRSIVDMAVVGFWEVLKHFAEFQTIMQETLKEVDRLRPAAAILVDYPGFNLRLAQELKKRGIPVIYYISPQIWAWGRKRITLIKRVVDLMLVLFQFEEELYRKEAVPVKLVGHPLLDTVRPSTTRNEFFAQYGLSQKNVTIALLPGSRKKEIQKNLPIMLAALRELRQRLPQLQGMILKSPSLATEIFQRIQQKASDTTILIENDTYNGINACDFALVASGTATLETALLEKPMFVIYKISALTWLIARMLITIPYIGLVNIIGGKLLAPEYIQWRADPARIARDAFALLMDAGRLEEMRQGLSIIRPLLGASGATKTAACAITGFLAQKTRRDPST